MTTDKDGDSFSAFIPQLTTERLVLRATCAHDLDGLCRLWGSPEVTKHITAEKQSRSKNWARVLSSIGHWALRGYGNWTIAERETGAFVGHAGLSDYERDIVPPIEGTPEAGWVLLPEFHGKGYATEAMVAALAWYDRTHGPGRTVCIIDEDNAASIRLAEKLGYQRAGVSVFQDHEVQLFERVPVRNRDHVSAN